MKRRPAETVVQRLVREMKASPAKAGLLGLGAVVAAFVWGPLLVAGGKEKPAVVAAGVDGSSAVGAGGATTESTVDTTTAEAAAAAGAATRRDPSAIRVEFIRIADQARGLRRLSEPVARLIDERDPFLVDEPAPVATPIRPVVDVDAERVIAEERDRAANLALTGVFSFPRGRRAVVGGDVVAVGDEVFGFAVMTIQEREVVLGGRFGKYRLSLGGMEEKR